MEKIAFLFPSHNVAYYQMGKTLYDNYSEVRDIFTIVNQEFDCKFEDIIFSSKMSKLNRYELKIMAVFLTSVTFHSVLKNTFQIEPDYYIGIGVGQLAALVCADAIQIADAVHYISQVTGYLADRKITEDSQVTDLQKRELVEMFQTVPVQNMESKEKVLNSLEDVPWEEIEFFVDLGPTRSGGDLVKKYKKQVKICYLDYEGDGYFPLSIFQTRKLKNYRFLLEKMLATAVCGQNTNYDEQSYATGVLEPYKKLKALCEQYHGTQNIPSQDEIAQALKYLTMIMENKGMDRVEITERLNRLESETLIHLQ